MYCVMGRRGGGGALSNRGQGCKRPDLFRPTGAGLARAVRWCDRVDDRGACGGASRRESGGDPDPDGALDRPARLVPAGGVRGGGEGSGFWACGGGRSLNGRSPRSNRCPPPERAGRRVTVTVPTLPGCVTSGETVDEAIAMAREGVEFYFKELPTSQRI